ncbi:MAG: hypothetical protein DMF40_16020 [Verrucomicrobia bacterium]|nr:MAG: hypothetical protein DMF40_16020 [Verrucomicrobiota bacterium]
MEIILALVIVMFVIFTASLHTIDANSRCEGRGRRGLGGLVRSSTRILSPAGFIFDSVEAVGRGSSRTREWLKPDIRPA